MSLTRDDIAWACRILLDREPRDDDEIEAWIQGCSSRRALRAAIVASEEYERRNPDLAATTERTLVITERDAGLRLVVDLSDHAAGLSILRGRYELNELDFVRRTVRPGQHTIDAGAHVGLFALHMARLVGSSGSVHAFEPYAPSAECLARAIGENGFGGRVVLERAALGARNGTAEIVLPRRSFNPGSACLRREGWAVPEEYEVHEVRVVALDAYPLPRPVSFIKLDVEGAEPLVIAGAARLLTEDRPTVLAELHPWQLERVAGMSPGEFLRQVGTLGYRAFHLGAGVVGDAMTDAPAEVTSVVLLPLV
jgi:FkbM family methyltransferase